MLTTTAPGTRVRPAPDRLRLGWAPPVGTVIAPDVLDLVAVDELTGRPVPGLPAGKVTVHWDGRHHPDRVDPADLIPAAAVAAVA